MKSFKEFINEADLAIQPTSSAVPVATTSPAPSEEDIDPAALCEFLLRLYSLMDCWGIGEAEPQRSCPIWRDLLIEHGCLSAPVSPEDEEDDLTPEIPGVPTKDPFAPGRSPHDWSPTF